MRQIRRQIFWLSSLAALLLAGVAYASPPIILTVPLGYVLTLSWTAVTKYANGAPLTTAPTYKLYSVNYQSGQVGFIQYMGNVTSFKIKQNNQGNFCYQISTQVYDPNANEGMHTAPMCFTVNVTGGPPTSVPPGTPLPVCIK